MSIGTGAQVVQISEEGIQAEALARSQLELVKDSAYRACGVGPCSPLYDLISSIPTQYTVSISVQPLDTATCLADDNCDTLQKVTVSITRPTGGGDRPIFSVSVYKVKQ